MKAGRFSEDEARFFFQQLVAGVDYCHSEARNAGSGIAYTCHASATRLLAVHDHSAQQR